MPQPVALHLAPHPDDELIGAAATLFALRDRGWRIVNLGCSLAHLPEHGGHRAHQGAEACRRAGFEFRALDQSIVTQADPTRRETLLVDALLAVCHQEEPSLVVAPSPHDRHPQHEAVGRSALAVCERLGARAPRLWLWGLWGDLPLPTLATAFTTRRLKKILRALGAYSTELKRNDYRRLVRGRASANAILAPERVFGFGSKGTSADFVEVLSEVEFTRGRWLLGQPRWLTDQVLAPVGDTDVSDLLHEASLTTRFGGPRGSPLAQ